MKKVIYIFAFVLIQNLTFSIKKCDAQWVQTNGPYGAIADGVMAAGSYVVVELDDVLGYKITNGGQTWTSLGNGLPLFRENYGFAYLAPNYFISCGGVYKSTDNGNNWFAVNNGLPTNSVDLLFGSGNNLFCSTYGTTRSVYISTNQGINWQNAGYGLPYSYSFNRFLQIGGTIFVLAGYTTSLDSMGVYSTTNNGTSWTRAMHYGLPSNYPLNDITCKSGVLFASNYHNVYKSTDGGNNWLNVSGNLPDTSMGAITNDGTNIYVATGLGLYKTTSDGNYWYSVNNGLQGVSIRDILSFNSDLFIPTRWDGIFKSTNEGNNWNQFHSGILNSWVTQTVTLNGAIIVNSNENKGIFKTTDNGNNWFSATNGFPELPYASILYVNGTDIYAGVNLEIANVNQVWKSTNTGISWFSSSSGLSNSVINDIVSNSSGIFCATETGVYKSTNNGTGWSITGMTNKTKHITSSTLNLVANVNDTDIFVSSNNGSNWIRITDGLPSGYNYFYELKAFGNKVYASITSYANSGIYFSSNNGLNWQYRNNGISTNTMMGSFISYNNFIFTAGATNIYKTTNDGLNWLEISSNLSTNYRPCSLVISGLNIFVGTGGASVWRRPLSEVIGIKNISTEVPSKYSLMQNYPNPFNSSTNIKFQIKNSNYTTLKIFDILGKEIEILVNDKLSSGTYSVDWDASHYPSGVYFYKLITDNYSDTKKMILIK